jgi:hypothetical protein
VALLEAVLWLAESIHDRWPWLGPALVVSVLVAGLLACASVSTAPGGYAEVRPGLRVLAVCFERGVVHEVRAYPISGTLAGAAVVTGALLGAGIGAAVGPEGAAVGAGVGALIGGLVDVLGALRGGPDPVPVCPP